MFLLSVWLSHRVCTLHTGPKWPTRWRPHYALKILREGRLRQLCPRSSQSWHTTWNEGSECVFTIQTLTSNQPCLIWSSRLCLWTCGMNWCYKHPGLEFFLCRCIGHGPIHHPGVYNCLVSDDNVDNDVLGWPAYELRCPLLQCCMCTISSNQRLVFAILANERQGNPPWMECCLETAVHCTRRHSQLCRWHLQLFHYFSSEMPIVHCHIPTPRYPLWQQGMYKSLISRWQTL